MQAGYGQRGRLTGCVDLHDRAVHDFLLKYPPVRDKIRISVIVRINRGCTVNTGVWKAVEMLHPEVKLNGFLATRMIPASSRRKMELNRVRAQNQQNNRLSHALEVRCDLDMDTSVKLGNES